MALFWTVLLSLVSLIFVSQHNSNSVDVKNDSLAIPDSRTQSEEFRVFVCAFFPQMRIPFNKNTTYEIFFNQMKTAIEAETNDTRTFPVYTKLVGNVYRNDCSNVYSTFVDCFEESKKTNFNSMVFHGPWCALDKYDRDVKTVRKYFTKLTDKDDVAILTVVQNFLPLNNDEYLLRLRDHPDLDVEIHQRALMFLTGSIPRMGYGLWHLLAVHFKYRHVALVVLGQMDTTTFSHCSRQLETFQILASIYEPLILVNYYKWPLLSNTTIETYREIWQTLKNVVRIILLCAQDNYSLKFVEAVEMDRKKTKNDVYGLFIVHRNIETYKSYLGRLAERNVSEALMYIKLIVTGIAVCPEYKSDIMHKVLNDSSGLDMERRDLGATYDKYIGATFCSFLHYYRQIANASRYKKRVASLFAASYRTDTPQLVSRKGKAIQWLPVMTVYSPDKNVSIVNPVLELNWKTIDKKTDSFVKVLGSIKWYNRDKQLFDGLYICSNKSSFYPCPQKGTIAKLSETQIVFIVFSIVFALMLVGVIVGFAVRTYRRNSRDYLLRRWKIAKNRIHTKGKERKNHKSVGTFKNGNVLLFPVKTHAQHHILESAEVVREFHQIATFSKQHDNQFIRLFGFVCDGNADFKLVFATGSSRSLKRILKLFKLSSELRLSLIRDLAVSINSIHEDSSINVHGNLTTDVCGVDERFVLRVLLTRLSKISRYESHRKKWSEPKYYNLLWTAPELIRKNILEPTRASDVYSFGIIMHEISFQRGPFYLKDLQGKKHVRLNLPVSQQGFVTTHEANDELSGGVSCDESCAEMIINKIKEDSLTPTMPFGQQNTKYEALDSIMISCWNEKPEKRPSIASILNSLKKYMKLNKIDLAFKMVKRLMLVSRQMVKELNKKNSEVIRERDRCLKYLTHMMPPSVSYEFMREETSLHHEICNIVTIYFNDLVEFKTINEEPRNVIILLDDLFRAYDRIVALYDVLPLHRVGSSLLLASGVQNKTTAHASEIAQVRSLM